MPLHFLTVGFTRCGTTWLHEKLRGHPQVWLPPQKELHYFTVQRQEGFWNRKHRRHLREWRKNLRAALLEGQRTPFGEFAWQVQYQLGQRSDVWFKSLSWVPRRFVTGMNEPTYATLPLEAIRDVHLLEPRARLLFLMRDPIDRAWSSVTKSKAKNLERSMDEVDEEEIHEKLDRSALAMSRYLEHIERWESVWPADRIHFGFFEEIEREPEAFLDRLLERFELEPLRGQDAGDLREVVNDTRAYKVDVPPHIEAHLARELVEPTRRLAARFGGHPERWLARMEKVLAEARPA